MVAGDDVEKSFDSAQDSVKQLIALSPATVTITITFATDLVGADGSSIILKWAWVVLVVSVIGGVVALLAMSRLVGSREPRWGRPQHRVLGRSRSGRHIAPICRVLGGRILCRPRRHSRRSHSMSCSGASPTSGRPGSASSTFPPPASGRQRTTSTSRWTSWGGRRPPRSVRRRARTVRWRRTSSSAGWRAHECSNSRPSRCSTISTSPARASTWRPSASTSSGARS